VSCVGSLARDTSCASDTATAPKPECAPSDPLICDGAGTAPSSSSSSLSSMIKPAAVLGFEACAGGALKVVGCGCCSPCADCCAESSPKLKLDGS